MITQSKEIRSRLFAVLVVGMLVGGVATAADSQLGQEIYAQTCVACHGADGRGVLPGVPDFTSAGGPLAKEDAVLLRNITDGFQTPGSPMAMPPKGGNPDLTEEDILSVLLYLREKYGT